MPAARGEARGQVPGGMSRPPFRAVLAFAFVAALAVTALGSDGEPRSVAAPAAASSTQLREVAALPALRVRRHRVQRKRPTVAPPARHRVQRERPTVAPPEHRPAIARKRARAAVSAPPRARPVVTVAPRPSAGVQAPVTAAPPAVPTPKRFDSAGGFDSSG